MTLSAVFFWLVAGLTGASAVMVVLTQNIVRAAAWLLFTLAGTSAVYFLLGADFVGATQLIVYVGGTLVLVVFGVMLTAQGPFVSMRSGPGEWAVAMVVGCLFFAVLAGTTARFFGVDMNAAKMVWPTEPPATLEADQTFSSQQLGLAFLGSPEATPAARMTGIPAKDKDGKDITPPRRTQTAYLLPFEVVSVHLTVVLIGAAYLARAKRRREVPA